MTATTPISAERQAIIDRAVSELDKAFGKGSIMQMKKAPKVEVATVPTGVYTLDHKVIGVGGFPKGRIIEVYGPEACVDASTFIQYAVHGTDGSRVNSKGGTIERLYERFHGLPPSGDGRGKWTRHTTKDHYYTAPCVNEEGRIFHNRIVDVLKTGDKVCFYVETEDGQRLIATADHKFLSNHVYKPLSQLKVGDTVSVHNCTPFEVEEPPERIDRPDVFVKCHPVAGTKTVFSDGKYYTYRRLNKARAIVEASMNGLNLDQYIEALNQGDIQELSFLDRNDHVHHLDEDCTNNDPSNLMVLTASEHTRLHAMERHNNLRFRIVDTTITYIELLGVRSTYDLRMESPFNNYVANGFVVHNSGKTTTALLAIGSAQRNGGAAALIDTEHAFDPEWATKNGVNVDDLFVSQPDYGEQALQIVEKLLETHSFEVIVVDSVAALVPKAELDGEIGDANIGLQARLMSQAMRKLTGLVSKSNTVLIFTNQLREKVGVYFGSPEVTTGGRALKFYASVRLDVRRIGAIKDGDVVIGSKTRIKAVKNKVAAPFRETEIDLLFATGVDRLGNLVDAAIDAKIIERSGAWFKYKGANIGQGRVNTIAYIAENNRADALLEQLKEQR